MSDIRDSDQSAVDMGTAPPQTSQPNPNQPALTGAQATPGQPAPNPNAPQPTTPQGAPSNKPDVDTAAAASIPASMVNNPAVPTQKMAFDADANKTSPAPHHSWINAAAEALAGGPRYAYQVDDAGNMVKSKVPVSTAHLGLAIALEALKGGLAGMGAQNSGDAAAAGLSQGEKDQKARQQQDQQARNNATEDSDHKQKITEANMRNYQLATLVGDKSKEVSQTLPDAYKPITDAIDGGTINLPGIQRMFESDAAASVKNGKTNVTNTLMIPYGDAQPVMENGEQKKVNGIPVWGHNYMVVPNADKAKVTLTQQMQDEAHKVGMFLNADGTPANIGTPEWSFPDLAQKMSVVAQVKAGEQLLQLHKNDAHNLIGKPVEDLDSLPTAVRTNPQMRTALQLYSKMAGTDSIDTILGKMNATDPQSASLLMQYLKLTPKDMEDMGNARLKSQTAAKEEAKAENKAEKTPEELAHIKAETAQNLSAVAKNTAELGKIHAETDKLLKDKDSTDSIVDAIGSGHIAPDRIGYILARKPELLDAVVKKYPDFDSSKAESYPTTYKDFTSGKTSVALNAGGTAFLHLKELNDLNTDLARIPGTKDYQRYENKVDTVADELAKFYGNSTIPGIASYKTTLNSLLNRGAAIATQSKSMGDKIDQYEHQWTNAAPSKAYQAPLPGISNEAKQARAALDPDYAKRSGLVQGGQAAPQFSKVSASGKFGWDGKAWVPIGGK